ncbi:MAG: TetR/AcrR family transcriptional regulator [Rhodococcus sp. (in: high G+C Gram-positive bacteria)]
MTSQPDRPRWREYEPSQLPKPLAAALAAFVDQGYHGASIRDIATRAGLSVPGLYHHYPSKQALLVGLTSVAMTELLDRSRSAEAEAGPDPRARFDAVVESLLRFHMFRQQESFIASSEIRSMEPGARAEYIDRRDEQQRQVDRIVAEGVEAGLFRLNNPGDVSRAVVTMCVAVAGWYRADGPLTPDELVARYGEIARNMVRATTTSDTQD